MSTDVTELYTVQLTGWELDLVGTALQRYWESARSGGLKFTQEHLDRLLDRLVDLTPDLTVEEES